MVTPVVRGWQLCRAPFLAVAISFLSSILPWLIGRLLLAGAGLAAAVAEPLELQSRRELFVDGYLIERLDGAQLKLGQPVDEGSVLTFDLPWEVPFAGATSILQDGDVYRLYYRGANVDAQGEYDESSEVTCLAESRDGIHWTKPILGLHDYRGNKANNIVMPPSNPLRASHNFAVFLDERPDVPPEERYKAVGGTSNRWEADKTRPHGLFRHVSADGINWRLYSDEPLFQEYALDTLNVVIWSQAEQCYAAYIRPGNTEVRRVARSTSKDFKTWTEPVLMDYGDTPLEHIYTNATHPYFRAPHLLIALPFRYVPNRAALSEAEHRKLGTHYTQRKGLSDVVLMSSRGGTVYDRTFLESFIRPGLERGAWTARSNLPSFGLVQTSPTELSLYLTTHHTTYDYHLRRYSLRLDGFASVNAPFSGGELVTKVLTFTGGQLVINYATSSIGSVRVEVQDEAGRPLPGYALADADEIVGDEIARTVTWRGAADVSALAGRPVRLRFVMKDADLYSLRFSPRP
jgi:hypothetical protein